MVKAVVSPEKGAKRAKRGKIGSAAAKSIPNFTLYIFRVLKQVHPSARISKMSLSVINRFAHHIWCPIYLLTHSCTSRQLPQ